MKFKCSGCINLVGNACAAIFPHLCDTSLGITAKKKKDSKWSNLLLYVVYDIISVCISAYNLRGNTKITFSDTPSTLMFCGPIYCKSTIVYSIMLDLLTFIIDLTYPKSELSTLRGLRVSCESAHIFVRYMLTCMKREWYLTYGPVIRYAIHQLVSSSISCMYPSYCHCLTQEECMTLQTYWSACKGFLPPPVWSFFNLLHSWNQLMYVILFF